ncbi:hypothetical protein CAEBREN_12849 [Caenorhabditis brenneri]|uniref:GYF domain-containing protein n=1 Tax=Caenorhabditis brenneri TaxID=135651 RepID=G0MKC7_CAEBE|nr:hypothetical protein CAEBREN_12849 [Caenorhabditis brenneri]
MSSLSVDSSIRLFKYGYIDLEGNKYGPFDGLKMAEWDLRGNLDDELIIFRISACGEVNEFLLKNLKKASKTPFLEIDFSTSPQVNTNNENQSEVRNLKSPVNLDASLNCKQHFSNKMECLVPRSESETFCSVIRSAEDLKKTFENEKNLSTLSLLPKLSSNNLNTVNYDSDCTSVNGRIMKNTDYCQDHSVSSSVDKPYHPEVFNSPPFMRLPDPECSIIKPENARSKVFSLYQLIITVPEQLKHFHPFTTETVCCQLCRMDLTGPDMFTHLVNIQHLSKVSNCIFTESDVDYWIDRVNQVIKASPASERKLTGKFLSQVVALLVKEVHRPAFQRRYGKLLEEQNTCTFCNLQFESFYDACCHIGTKQHRDKISNLCYHEGLVATWVRLLARNDGYKKELRLHKTSWQSKDTNM